MTAKQKIEILNRMRHDVYEDSEEDQVLYYAIRAIEQLEGKDTDVPGNVPDMDIGDTIYRQAAIDALNKEIIKRRLLDDVNDGMLDEFDTEDILRKLPSAQPEILAHGEGELSAQPKVIRCKDCKYRGVGNYCIYGTRLAWVAKSNDFCSKAERRTDE